MGIRWRRVAFPVLAVAAVLFIASTLSNVLVPVLVAALLAVILEPVLEGAERFRLPRVATVIMLYLVLGMGLTLTASTLADQFQALARALGGEPFLGDLNANGLVELADGVGALEDEFVDLDGDGLYDAGALVSLELWVDEQLASRGGEVLGTAVSEVRVALLETLADLARPAGSLLAQAVDRVAHWAGGFFALLTLIVLIPFYLFFFLVEYPTMSRRLRELVPPRHREQVDRIGRDIGRELVSFLRGRLACGVLKAVLLWVGMVWLGLEYALPIALVAGLLSLVPFLGFLAGVVPASVIALTMPGGGTEPLVWVVALFVVGEGVEGGLLYPLVLGKETGLHPVAIVVVLLAGGALMGTFGVLVAIPLALVIKVLWRELVLPLYRDWAYPPADELPAGTGADAGPGT